MRDIWGTAVTSLAAAWGTWAWCWPVDTSTGDLNILVLDIIWTFSFSEGGLAGPCCLTVSGLSTKRTLRRQIFCEIQWARWIASDELIELQVWGSVGGRIQVWPGQAVLWGIQSSQVLGDVQEVTLERKYINKVFPSINHSFAFPGTECGVTEFFTRRREEWSSLE